MALSMSVTCQLGLRHAMSPALSRVSLATLAAPVAIHAPRVLRFETVDAVFVGLAGVILVGVGLLQKSLGDVVGDEAQLPPVTGARAKRELGRSRRFLNRPPKKRD
mmetsp:Transcript_38546/g.94425  ORF Transcript_38546/g.94425 Transcript_38546/m.94425 type:complete len:106 (-) Transcript_38546:886-1203(-)